MSRAQNCIASSCPRECKALNSLVEAADLADLVDEEKIFA
jgi:hypothetical protein